VPNTNIPIAAQLSTPSTMQDLRQKFPEAQLDWTAELMTADAAAWHVHELHKHGYLVLDDDHLINLAVPPKTATRKWILNGHDEA
jgi:ADP-heptose:LPS heptosyltransferase